MAVVGNVSADRLADLLENSVSALPGNGRFAQISGIQTAGNGLGGLVTASAYPLEGVGRITVVPLPAAAWLMLGELASLAGIGRQGRRLVDNAA